MIMTMMIVIVKMKKNKKVRLILTALFLFKEYRVIQLQTLGVRMVG